MYHVMNRGNARQPIFQTTEDYQVFLDLLKESIELWNIKIHAFGLMPNHYHLLLETPLGNLSRAMRHIDGVYTQRYNRKCKRDGHLFRGRYKAILVEDDAYLVELARYIHLNPVKAKIVNQPQQYKWSSHRNYLGNKKPEWLTMDRLLDYFGRGVNLARRKFHKFVLEGVPQKLYERLEGKKWPSVFSSENFQEWVEWNFVRDLKDREVQYETFKSVDVTEEEIKKIITAVLDIDWKSLCEARGFDAKMKKHIAIRCYRRYIKYAYSRLSSIFGGIHPTNIARAMSRDLGRFEPLWESIQIGIQNAKRKT
jgi:REP element-mobilizing transposase RayT